METPSCSEAVLVDNVVPVYAERGTRHLLVHHEGFCHDGSLLLRQQCTHLLELLAGFLSGGIDRVHGDRITLRNGAK